MTDYTYRIIRSSRKTVAVSISPRGEVTVRCPRRMAESTVRRFVAERDSWIRAHLEKLRAQPQQPVFTRQELEELRKLARQDLAERTARIAPILGVSYGRITIRCQRGRWGSCSGAGNLNFNCLLMLAPPMVRDYVVVHELCHRRHMDHSSAFWSLVAETMPDFKAAKLWLKQNGAGLLARLPEDS